MSETRSRYSLVSVLVVLSLLVPLFSMNIAAASLPDAPINVTATSGISRVTLNWTAPVNPGGSAIIGYSIHKGTDLSEMESYAILNPTPCTYVDLTVTNGQRYYYFVAAIYPTGEGSPSENVTAKPLNYPNAPTATKATPGIGQMTLSWNPPYNDGGSPVTNYRIYRGTSPSPILFLKNSTQTFTNDTGLSNGQTYYYLISAVNEKGEGAKCDLFHRTLASAPGPLLDVQARPSASSVNLTWTAPSDNGGSIVTGYLVYRSAVSGFETFMLPVLVTHYQDNNLVNGVTYFYQISAVNDFGEGRMSNEVACTPAAVLGPPTSINLTPSNSSVSLSWTAPVNTGGSPASSYKIYRGTSPITLLFLASVNQTSYLDTNLTNGHGYYYKVSSVNAVGEGSLSQPFSSMPINTASVPVQLTSTAGIRSVALSWSSPTDNGGAPITAYRVYRSLSGTGSYVLVASLLATSYTDRLLSNGTQYFYRVTAVNPAGEGPATETNSTTFPLPVAPVLNADLNDLSVQLSWSVCPSATSYRIYRGDVSGAQTYLKSVLTNSYLDGPFVSGRTLYYIVTSVNATGESGFSNEAGIKIVSLPSAPTDLKAYVAWSRAFLSWTAPVNTGGSSSITYQVLRGLSPGAEQVIATCNSSMYNDSTMVPGQLYYYQVNAVNEAGAGASSNEVELYYTNIFTAPTLSATAGVERITLRWTTPTDTDGNALTGYQVYRRSISGMEVFLIGVNVNELTDTGVVAGQTYYYQVKGVTEAELGPSSNEVSAIPQTVPGIPVQFSASSSADSAILNWSVPVTDGCSAVIGYHVFRGVVAGNLSMIATVYDLGYRDTVPVAGTTYYYAVTAFNAAGDGQPSSEASIATPVLNDPPIGLTATAADGKITLVWNQPAGANVFTYSIFRGNDTGVEVFLTNYPATSWVDRNVTSGQTYYYKVSALTTHGESQLSEEAMATPIAAQNQAQGGLLDQMWFRIIIIMTILAVGFFSFVIFVKNGNLRVKAGSK